MLISNENISEPASIVKGVSSPSDLAIPIAIAVLPVPGCPPIRMALPAILPALIIFKMIPAALLASTYNNIRRFSTYLTDHTLTDFAWVKTVVQSQTTNVGMSANTFDSSQIFDFLYLGVDA